MQQIKFGNVFLVLCITFPILAQAAPDSSLDPDKLYVESGIGLISSHFSYDEPSLQMHESGNLKGAEAYIALHDRSDIMLRLEGSYIDGHVDYKSPSGTISDLPDRIFEVRGLIGSDFYSEGWRITPYTGLGFRRLVDNGDKRVTSNGNFFYKRTQDYTYLPIGIFFQTFQNESPWSLTVNLEYDYLISGQNDSEIRENVPQYGDLHFAQKSGYGGRASVTLSRDLDLGIISAIGISPYVKYWNIRQSDYTYRGNRLFFEPDNHSTEYGVKIMFTM